MDSSTVHKENTAGPLNQKRSGPLGRGNPKVRNIAVACGLLAFVGSVYSYTLKAVGGTDELERAIKKFEKEKPIKENQDTPSASTSSS